MTETPKETALAVRPQVLPSASQFQIMRDLALRLASARGFLPDHYLSGTGEERFAKVLAAIEYGRAVGIEPMIALQNLTLINGKVGASALLIAAQLRKGGYEISPAKYSADESECEITVSKNGKVTGVGKFSIADAQRAGLVKPGGAWVKTPRDMLYARALTQAARQGAQDAVLGMAYTGEELGEPDEEPTTTLPAGPAPVDVIEGEITGEIPTDKATPESVAALKQAQGVTAVPGTAAPESASASQVNSGAGSGSAPVPPPPGPSRGPRAKRGNVVPAPQATVGEAVIHTQQVAPVATAGAPAIPASLPPLVDPEDGQAEYLNTLRQQTREVAAKLQSIRVRLFNHKNAAEIALGNVQAQTLVPEVPNPGSDAALAAFINNTYPGKALADLSDAELDGTDAQPGILRTLDALVERVSKGLPA